MNIAVARRSALLLLLTGYTLPAFGLVGDLVFRDGFEIVATISVAPTPAFPPQLVGSTSVPITVIITNVGAITLNLSEIGNSGADASDFMLDLTGTQFTLAPTASTALKVTFHPLAPWKPGARQAQLNILGNVPGGVVYSAESGMGVTCGGAVPACSSGCADTDGDGLNDTWKIAGGIDFNNDGVVSASEKVLTSFDPLLPDGTVNPHPSAEPGRKDVFVRYDYMQVSGTGATCSTPSDCGGHCSNTWATCNTSADCGTATCVSDQYCVGHGSVSTSNACNTDSDLGGHCSATTAQSCSTNDQCPHHCSMTASQSCSANADCPMGEACGNYCSGSVDVTCRTNLDCGSFGVCVTSGSETCTSNGETCVARVCTGHSDAPSPAALLKVITAYADHGINLHISAQHAALPHATVTSYGPPINGCAAPSGHLGDAGRAIDFYAVKPTATTGSGPQRPFIHYAVFGHFYTCDSPTDCAVCPPDPGGRTPVFGETGFSEIVGNDMILAYGTYWEQVNGRTPPSDLAMGGTFMHELGHNLGLDHGGPTATADHLTNYKPNYLSVMNYSFQSKGISSASSGCASNDNLCKTTPVGSPRLDYSNVALAALNEANLNETIGINSGTTDITTFFCAGLSPGQGTQAGAGTGFINWDCDVDKGSETRSGSGLCGLYGVDCPGVDIHNDISIASLAGANDWANLNFKFQCDVNGHYGNGASLGGITSQELDLDTAMGRHILFPTKSVAMSVQTGCSDKTTPLAQSGTLSVVLLGTDDFDVRQVDATSLRLHGAKVVSVSIGDLNGDGKPDMVAEFDTNSLRLSPNAPSLRLTGWLKNSQLFVGEINATGDNLRTYWIK